MTTIPRSPNAGSDNADVDHSTTTASLSTAAQHTSEGVTTTTAAQQLPDEILNAIFSNLVILADAHHEWHETDEDKLRLKTLCSISLASKHFQSLARPFLFGVLDFDTSSVIRDEVTRTTEIRCPSPKPILRALCKDPSLGRCVRGIRVGHYYVPGSHDNERAGEERVPPDDELVQLYLAVLNQFDAALPRDICARLRDGLMKGHREAELAMVVAMASKVQWLDLTALFWWQDGLIAAVATACGAVSPQQHQQQQLDTTAASTTSPAVTVTIPLQELRRIDTYYCDTEGGMYMSEVDPVLNLPALRDLFLHRTFCVEDFDPASITPSLRRVRFAESYVNTAGLQKLLQASPHLTDLHIESVDVFTCEGTYRYGEPGGLTFVEFGELLSQHGTRLQKVHLELWQETDIEHPQMPVTSLSTLTELKELTLQVDALFTHSRAGGNPHDLSDRFCLTRKLPVSLKSLRLLGCSQHEQDPDPSLVNLQLLQVMRDQSFSNLRRIELHRTIPKVEGLDMTGIPFHAFKTVKEVEGDFDQTWQVSERLE